MSGEGDRNEDVAEALAGQDDGKSNAEIGQQARIDAVLETMLGRPLVKLDSFHPGNALAWGMADNPPDLLNIEAPPSYAKLKAMIASLEDAARKSKTACVSIKALSATYQDLTEIMDQDARSFGVYELDVSSLTRVAGVCKSVVISSAQFYILASKSADNLSKLRDFIYPTGPGRRRKNVHAYMVAEQLAAFYRTARREMPTFGTGDGGIPSTDYARALEAIFEILGIEAKIRGPAEAAIARMKEAETNGDFGRFSALAGVLGNRRA